MCVFIPPTMHIAGSKNRTYERQNLPADGVRHRQDESRTPRPYDAQDNLTNHHRNHRTSFRRFDYWGESFAMRQVPTTSFSPAREGTPPTP